MINTIKKTAAVICAAVLVLTLCSCAKPDYTIGGATVKYNEGDYKTALEMFEVLAKEGDGVAACYAGNMYYKGEGAEIDTEKAKEYFEISAKADNTDGIYNLGVYYDDIKNFKTAKEYYQRAAYRGHAMATNNLGIMYEKGLGVNVDYKRAADYYKVAAAKGVESSMMHIAALYEQGKGVEQDVNLAKDYYKMAADAGNQDAVKKLEELK